MIIKTRVFIDYIKNLPKEEYSIQELIEIISGAKFESKLKLKDYIIFCVEDEFEYSYKKIIAKGNDAEFVECRKAICYFLSKYTTLSQKNIGEIVNRDHSTVFHGKQWVLDNFDNPTQEEFYQKINNIEIKIKQYVELQGN